MVSRRRILGFAIGKMLRQDGWAEKYNPKNEFHVVNMIIRVVKSIWLH